MEPYGDLRLRFMGPDMASVGVMQERKVEDAVRWRCSMEVRRDQIDSGLGGAPLSLGVMILSLDSSSE